MRGPYGTFKTLDLAEWAANRWAQMLDRRYRVSVWRYGGFRVTPTDKPAPKRKEKKAA